MMDVEVRPKAREGLPKGEAGPDKLFTSRAAAST